MLQNCFQKVVYKTSEATEELIENKIPEKIVQLNPLRDMKLKNIK